MATVSETNTSAHFSGLAICRPVLHRLLIPAMLLSALVLSGCEQMEMESSNPMVDLSSVKSQWAAFARIRADSSGKEVVTWWDGKVFALVPGEKPQALFGIIGFNIGRLAPQQDGTVNWLSREVAYYTNLKTGEILTEWNNPYTNKKVRVVDVFNDPVSSKDYFGSSYPLPYKRGQDGLVTLQIDVPLEYPNPLRPKAFPKASSGDTYRASEHFLFYAQEKDLAGSATSVPITIGWTRSGPWLPWMLMGDEPGTLLYVSVGGKHKSLKDLDSKVLNHTQEHHPKFLSAPEKFESPNETSWTVYRDLMTSGGKKP